LKIIIRMEWFDRKIISVEGHVGTADFADNQCKVDCAH